MNQNSEELNCHGSNSEQTSNLPLNKNEVVIEAQAIEPTSQSLPTYDEGSVWSWKEVARKPKHNWGGKAFKLGLLAEANFAVPPGVVLTRLPTIEDWQILMAWWDHIGRPSLAIRSSAANEDGDSLSFAGQQKTFLNQTDEFTILDAIHSCFEGQNNLAVQAYSEHFELHGKQPMNVIVQVMIDAQFSGVYFSTDPIRNDGHWVIEIVPGQGEALVSGQVTPVQIRSEEKCSLSGWEETWTEELVLNGLKARDLLGHEVDMEWTIDQHNKLWILQARPITALPKNQSSAPIQPNLDEPRHNESCQRPVVKEHTNEQAFPVTELQEHESSLSAAPHTVDSPEPSVAAAIESLPAEPLTTGPNDNAPLVIHDVADITTSISALQSDSAHLLTRTLSPETKDELRRILSLSEDDTIWDGQTFAECSGPLSTLSLSIWQEAFGPRGSFAKALKILGYHGFAEHDIESKITILEDILGHAYINFTELLPLYFGEIPYSIAAEPRPHLKFNWRKVNRRTLMRTPSAIFNMAQVAWKLQTQRKRLTTICEQELLKYQSHLHTPPLPSAYELWPEQELKIHFLSESHLWADDAQKWNFVLVILAEAGVQSLQTLFGHIFKQEESQLYLHKLLSYGLHTVTQEMQEDYIQAIDKPQYIPQFLSKFGHRGPGDLDLAKPRWQELAAQTFYRPDRSKLGNVDHRPKNQESELEIILEKIPRFYQATVRQEWSLLQHILELRERWKFALMRPYTQLRWMALELGNRWQLGADIFYLKLSEIEVGSVPTTEIREKIDLRKHRLARVNDLNLPPILHHQDLERLLDESESPPPKEQLTLPQQPTLHQWRGETLSAGVAYGEVRVVTSPELININEWPEHVILVAESTDPTWTPLFLHASGIIIEKGGLLSHSAIVARELGIPAVSQINYCHQILKDGDYVWLDASKGQVIRHSKS